MPEPGDGKNYRFKVLYPEDKQYTVKPLKMQKLGGRDPETGQWKWLINQIKLLRNYFQIVIYNLAFKSYALKYPL